METSAKNKSPSPAHLLTQKIQSRLQSLTPDSFSGKIIIAYSGGIDSHVLLHALTRIDLPENTRLHAVYIHHGLQKEASQWQRHCQKICQSLQVSFTSIEVQVKQGSGLGLEAEARLSRYKALAQCMEQGSILLTAQHQDDQAETLLLQLIRGAGVEGIAAMPTLTHFHQGWHIRPMLDISQNNINEYAKTYALSWLEDPSNNDRHYARNYLRHQVMPVLKKRWPSVNKTLSRSAQHCANNAALLNTLLWPVFKQAYNAKTISLSLNVLREKPLIERESLLRLFIKTVGFDYPSTKKMHDIQAQIFSSKTDASPCITWGEAQLRRYQQRLYLMPILPPFDTTQRIEFSLETLNNNALIIDIKSVKNIEIRLNAKGIGLPVNLLLGKRLSIRFRQGGERLFISTQQRHHSLKKYFQEQGIPPWQRNRTALLYAEDTLLMVASDQTITSIKKSYKKTSIPYLCISQKSCIK